MGQRIIGVNGLIKGIYVTEVGWNHGRFNRPDACISVGRFFICISFKISVQRKDDI